MADEEEEEIVAGSEEETQAETTETAPEETPEETTDEGEVTTEVEPASALEEVGDKEYENAPPTRDNSSETEDEDEACALVCKAFCKLCKFCVRTYKDKFKRDTITCTAIFILAIKLAQECKGLAIPMT